MSGRVIVFRRLTRDQIFQRKSGIHQLPPHVRRPYCDSKMIINKRSTIFMVRYVTR